MRFWLVAIPQRFVLPPNRSHAAKLLTLLRIVCTGLVLLIAGILSASAAPRNAVLLFDERVELPGLSLLNAELVHTLEANSAEPIEVFREVMDLSRFDSSSHKTLLRDYLRAKYAGKQIDVAVAIMAPAFDFLLASGGEIFPGAQIVFCGLDRKQLATRSLPANVYGALIKREFAPTLELALRLHPATENVVVISGTSEFDKGLLAQAQTEFRPHAERVSITYLSEIPLQQLLTKVSQLESRTIILFLTVFQDGTGQSFVPHEVVARVASAASVPVYGFLDQFLGRGIVGGSLYSTAEYGAVTAKIVLRLLSGALPQQHLSDEGNNKLMFDWRQLQRWNISESRLPPGSEIHFRDQSIWQRYSWQISSVVAVLLIQAALILLLLSEHRRRQLAEVRSRQRMAELAHINRFSTAGELTASIAHEINQPLGSILTNAETAKEILKSQSPDVAKLPDIVELKDIVNDILHDDQRATEVIRRMRSLLKKAPFEQKQFDLNEVVQETIRFLSSLAIGRKFELVSVITPEALPILGDRIQLQQVILNLVMNGIDAMKDTPIENRIISIRTSRVEKFAQLSVSDRGSGIPGDKLKEVFEPFFTSKAEGMGMGLSIARTIIEAHQGLISAKNRDHGGASFRIKLPLRTDDAGSAGRIYAL
jgi:signal transduction histidine kinase